VRSKYGIQDVKRCELWTAWTPKKWQKERAKRFGLREMVLEVQAKKHECDGCFAEPRCLDSETLAPWCVQLQSKRLQGSMQPSLTVHPTLQLDGDPCGVDAVDSFLIPSDLTSSKEKDVVVGPVRMWEVSRLVVQYSPSKRAETCAWTDEGGKGRAGVRS